MKTFGNVRFRQPSGGGVGRQIELRLDMQELYLEFSPPSERMNIVRHAHVALEYISPGGIARKRMAVVLKSEANEVAIFAPEKPWWRRFAEPPPLKITEFLPNQTSTTFNYTGSTRGEQWLMHLFRVVEYSRTAKFAPLCLRDGTCVQQCVAPTCEGEKCACFPPFFCRLAVSEKGEMQCTEVKAVDHIGSKYEDIVFAGADDGVKRAFMVNPWNLTGRETLIGNALNELSETNHGTLHIITSRLPRIASVHNGAHGSVIRDETAVVWAWTRAIAFVSKINSFEPDMNSCPSRKSHVDALDLAKFMLQLLAHVKVWKTFLPAFVDLAGKSQTKERLQTIASILEERIDRFAAHWAKKNGGTSADSSSNAGATQALVEISAGTNANMTIEPVLCVALVAALASVGLGIFGKVAQMNGYDKTATWLYRGSAATLIVSGGCLLWWAAAATSIVVVTSTEIAFTIPLPVYYFGAWLVMHGAASLVEGSDMWPYLIALESVCCQQNVSCYGDVDTGAVVKLIGSSTNSSQLRSITSSNIDVGNSSNRTSSTPDDC
eukprot:TRINITY_DN11932_c0_g1_i1.p1 TRINITY_DN11932_c0_g1~~TRINITY_DN11932_c0_g1_i1.p1  ORF type:complete len:550 (-),score=45.26 TRINITY_DN11932_c0_g1_i1:111-1760(-)